VKHTGENSLGFSPRYNRGQEQHRSRTTQVKNNTGQEQHKSRTTQVKNNTVNTVNDQHPHNSITPHTPLPLIFST